MESQNCDSLDLLIIEKLGLPEKQAKEVRGQVASGQFDLDRLYHVSGRLVVGEDYPTTPTVNIPIKATLALLVRRLGFQREGALELIRECVTDAILMDEKAENEIKEATPQAEIMLEQVEQAVLKQLPKTKRKGAVNVKDVTLTRVVAVDVRPYQEKQSLGKQPLGKAKAAKPR